MHYNWQPLVYMDATLFSQTTSSSDNSVKFTASHCLTIDDWLTER